MARETWGNSGGSTMTEWRYSCRSINGVEHQLSQMIWPEMFSRSRSRRPELWGRLLSHNPVSESEDIHPIQLFYPHYSCHYILKDLTVLEGGAVINKHKNRWVLSQLYAEDIQGGQIFSKETQKYNFKAKGHNSIRTLCQNVLRPVRFTMGEVEAWPEVGTCRETHFLTFPYNLYTDPVPGYQEVSRIVLGPVGGESIMFQHPVPFTLFSLCILCHNNFGAGTQTIP